MKKNLNEIRDPIHNFIHVDRDELLLIDSRPFQRLRHIHQLALTYLVYPGASHKRFEHSLGVMELAAKAFDAITAPDNVDEQTRSLFPRISELPFLQYWRKVLRLAALCHDLGHTPFSHAAECLFPSGSNHETMTREIIQSDEVKGLFAKMVPRVDANDVVKLALGKKCASDLDDWEAILAEIITGDSLGVDRMDYLLRDAYHLGVAYGKFDHFRLLETLRIVPPPPTPPTSPRKGPHIQAELELSIPEEENNESSKEPMLGLLTGGIHAAEALLLARYFMYAQVYFHPVRIAYNRHLQMFLQKWLPEGKFPSDVAGHLTLTDNEVNSAIVGASYSNSSSFQLEAKRITERNHFRCLKEFAVEQVAADPLLPTKVYEALEKEFGEDKILIHSYQERKKPQEFPIRLTTGNTGTSLAYSAILRNYPSLDLNFILVDNDIREMAIEYMKTHFREIL